MKNLILLITILLAFTVSLIAQTVTFESAKAAYDAKDYKKAAEQFTSLIKQPQYKNDGSMWNFIGLSYRGAGEQKKSLKALKRAVQLAPADLTIRYNYAVLLSEANSSKALNELAKILEKNPNHEGAIYLRGLTYLKLRKYDEASAVAQKIIDSNPTGFPGYLLAARIKEIKLNDLVIKNLSDPLDDINLLKESIGIWEMGLQRCGNCADKEKFEYNLGIRRTFLKRIEEKDIKRTGDGGGGSELIITNQNDESGLGFKILSKPFARYTDKARTSNISGKVILLAAFGISEEVECFIVLKPLGGGLDENAIEALQNIKFTPAVKDGKRIATIRSVEYSFTIF